MGDGEHASYTTSPTGWSKLSEAEVRDILASEGVTQQALADEYHVSRLTIHRIIHGMTWRWVYDEHHADDFDGVEDDDDGMDMI